MGFSNSKKEIVPIRCIKIKILSAVVNRNNAIRTPIAPLIVSVKLLRSRLSAFFGGIQGRPLFCNISIDLKSF